MDVTNLPQSRGHGGKRPGAGRPRRTAPAVIRSLANEPITWRKQYRLMPVEFLLSIINDDQQPVERRIECAIEAAPYAHARLTTVSISNAPESPPIKAVLDVDRLDDSELLQLERLLEKASQPTPATPEPTVEIIPPSSD